MTASRDNPDNFERRRYPRIQVHVQVELQSGESIAPFRTKTSDLSLGGCYVETMFALEIGAGVMLTLWLNDEQIQSAGTVATHHPQVGNGFEFIDMTAEHRLKLTNYITAYEHANT
jgi:c-di-GMP-binding flagellar brake protein YcgR